VPCNGESLSQQLVRIDMRKLYLSLHVERAFRLHREPPMRALRTNAVMSKTWILGMSRFAKYLMR
jgi:hypothetical protein